MKRFYFPLLLMAAAAVAACQKKAAVEEPAQGSYVFTLRATSPDLDTKTDYTSTGTFSWSEGDAVSVLFHKGDDNKFFTLTNTSGAGASADFSGTIDEGYEIGGTDGNKWALYPAGAHSVRFAESDGTKFPINFNIPAVTDYTTSSFSANLPMYALGDDSDQFSFNLLCGAYKFKFTEISASKVKFVVENQTTYRLSGDVKLRNSSGTYLDQAWADGVDKTLTYITSVSDGTAVFYVPCRHYAACFKPIITLYDAETDEVIYTKTATGTNAEGSLEQGHIKPFTISVTGFEYDFPSKFGIPWKDITVEGEGDTSSANAGIKTFKAYADESYLYVYFVVDKSRLNTDAANEFANQAVLYVGDEADPNCTKVTWIWGDSEGSKETYTKDAALGWLTYYGAPAFYSWESIVGSDQSNKAGKAEQNGDYFYYEVRVPRNFSEAPMTSTSPSTAHVGMILYYQKIHGVSGSGSYMIAPKKAEHGSALLRVPLPAYVAPTN